MKRTFLIAGLIAGLTAANGYADIVISQTDENPDITISVARAAKLGTRGNSLTQASANHLTVSENNNGSAIGEESEVRYICPNNCIVELHGSQDDNNHNVTMEYTYCVNANTGAYCGAPTVEIVSMGSTVNYKPNGGRPNSNVNDAPVNYKPNHTADGRPNSGAAESPWDNWDGNIVNGGKKKR